MSSAAYLSLVMFIGVSILLFMIIKLKLQAFISLLIVSMGVGIAAGMPLDKVMSSIQNGMGGTLGFIAVVVGLGAMFGQMLEVSGGAERLARTLISKFGKDKASWALMITGFIISIPVFFDVAFIILVPIVYSLAKDAKKSVLYYGIPLLTGLAVTHSFVPPTPGPVAVAQLVNADLGKVILFGIIIGIPCAIIAGPIFGKYIGNKIYAEVPEYMVSDIKNDIKEDKDLPSFGFICFTILIPIILIVLNTFTNVYLPKGNSVRNIMTFVGHPFAALTIATLVAFIGLGRCRGLSREEVNKIATSSLNSSGLIILVTGAGGVFKQVLIDSGVGKMLAESVAGSHLSPILLAFFIAAVVRVAAGSATVAMMTAGGIVSPILSSFNVEPALIVIAIASGATVLSHVNDSGFWLVNRYFGISEKDTLRSWTMMETIIGVFGLIGCLILNLFV
ncbi:Gnt-I system low-affinity gluconate transporter [Clostridium tetanomorphum]|uniref:Gluconate transporter n=1 Tax=Clostridium tetanomorphum TaxID=1553 RepID=A0A923EA68_CLOTT|nr:gluconate:H+ symporter [Clostridium tetanomorphum]KAJ51066.1 gluconate transporter [Clostridium tetanomorphum DSM 665]KAJ51618.1 gluconate transporter [Clostridium tetanomorphum DSM 665]MBC2397986.1 gluconate transporter [Clostridium tetanomorphum]MBP1864508.1 Gnt-I system low-affinity gluconate transporter [Clostridium tetanomorphum]NRS82961.1 Gnt-I system low-affinity gluconate transporter [Clostridium tetanomorphum]